MKKFNCDYSSRFRILKGGKISLVVSALLGSVSLAFAAPSGGVVTSGSATISQSGNTTNIVQSTNKATINWNSFSIAGNETVNFNQPSVNSITLNRVVGNEKSIIDGALNANGQVWILNSNGILFNSTAKINTAGILATTKSLSDADFNAGNYKFTGNSTESVINMGEITITDKGYAALLADTVSNEGTIKAIEGNIVFANGEATINLNGNSLVGITVDKGVIDSLIENKGAVLADGGKILFTSKAADEILKNVVNNSGIVEAKSFDDMFGTVEMIAEGGYVENSGTIDVSSQDAKGGTATVTGYHTMIADTAVINADGATGGGTIQVGGSWQNSDTSVYQATGTIVQSGAKLTANATDNGDGGTVVAWSDIYNSNSVTRAYGTFEAKGGENGGNGGRIETSGHYLDVKGISPNTLAPNGNNGEWLLDPGDLYIGTTYEPSGGSWDGTSTVFTTHTSYDSYLRADDIASMLSSSNITLTAVSNLYIQSAINYISSNKLTLKANYTINVGANISNSSWGDIDIIYSTANYGSSRYIHGIGNISTQGNLLIKSSNGTTGFYGGVLSGNISAERITFDKAEVGLSGTVTTNNTIQLTNNAHININSTTGAQNVAFAGSGSIYIKQANTTIGGINSDSVSLDIGSYATTIGTIGGNASYLYGSGSITLNGSQNFNNYSFNSLNSSRFTGSITINNGGSTSIGDSNNYNISNAITVNSGGKLYVNGATLSGALTLSGELNLGSRTTTITRSSYLAMGKITGSGDLTLNASSGTMMYDFNNNSSTYSGTLRVGTNTTAYLSTANGAGTSGTIYVESGGAMYIASGITTPSGRAINLTGSGNASYKALQLAGSGTIGGNVTLAGATTIQANGGALTFSGTVGGNYALNINSNQTVTFNGAINSIASLTTDAGGSTIINANVTTTGAQTYNDTVSITGARTLISNNGQFNFTGGATANNNLILQSPASTSMALTGNINVGSYWLNLKNASGTSGTLSSTGTLSGTGLLVQNFATANLNLASGHNFTTIAANGIGTAYNYIDQNAVTIGLVNGVTGLTLGSATGNVATKTGNLTISGNIATTNNTVNALILNASSDTAALTSTGGDIIRTTGTISVGPSGTAKLYTGSVSGSTGLVAASGTPFVTGTGKYRYGSDESSSAYTKALSTGLNLIYREQPTIGAAVSSASKTYDGAAYSGTPTLSYTMQNGDTAGADITIGTFELTGDTTVTNAGSYSIGANLSGFANTLGYANPTTATEGTLTINQRVLNLSGTRVYDATTNIDASKLTTFGNIVEGENLVLDGTGTIVDRHVANGKVVTLGTLALANGTNGLASNYILTGGTHTIDITKADISSIGGITASNKVYDRETTATLDSSAATFNGKYGIDTLTVATATGNFVDKNAANGKTVNITALTLGGADAGNYNLVDTTASTTANITPKDLSLTGLTVNNKVYDRTTTATINSAGTLDGLISGDSVTVDTSGATASFAGWNVGDNKAITIGGVTITGDDATNYTLGSLGAGVTANITKKSLSLVLSGETTRVYDGTTDMGFSGYTVSADGVISGDTVAVDTGTLTGFINKNVGTNKQVTFSGFGISGADSGNYELVSGNAVTNASITKATISSVSGITAASKTYDATTNATLTTTGVTFNGIFGSDDLEVATATGTFGDKNVGTTKTVNISGITLAGNDAGNYLLADDTATTTADITQKALTITYTGVNKTYDGGISATVTTSDDRLGSDSFTIARTAEFDNTGGTGKNAGTNKTINITGVSLSGTDALNYSVTTTGTTTADILKKDVTLTGLAVDDKVYDGLTTATFSDTGTLIDYINGDDVAVDVAGMSAAFGDKNVGTAKSVTLSGVTLTGDDAGNYNFTSPTGATADITAKTLIVSYTGVNRVYDSTTNATVTTSDDRVTDDVFTINRTATFGDKNVADNKVVSVSGVSLSGTDALNYTVATTGTTTANITKADISTVSGITAQNKVYDTFDTATLVTSSAVFNGMFANDILNVANATGTFSDKNVNTGKTVSISGITLGGTDAGNYNLLNATATTTANISKATISAISGVTANSRVYDATTVATLNTAGAVFAGLLGSDDLSITASTASFGDKNVGTAKTVTIDSITFGGTDAGNYEIANNLSTLTADITPATISAITGIKAENKVYDRTTDATLDVSGASFTAKYAGDVLSVATSTGNFDNWNVGTGKTVNITGLTLGGTDANNYTLANSTASTTGNITPKALVLNLQGQGSKVYDGTASISLNGITPTLTGVIEGDTVDITTGSVTGFVDKNVGANKAVLYSGFALSNTDAGNYDIGSGTAPSTASITRLDSVTWVGGNSGNWFDPNNWADGAVPDLSNVANVIIPENVTVSFDTSGVVSPAQAGTVNIDSLGTLGSMTMTNGALNVLDDVTLNTFTQNGGTLAVSDALSVANLIQNGGGLSTNTLSATNSFTQSGTTGTIAVTNNAVINQTTGDMSLGNISTGGTLSATAQNGNINQVVASALVPTGLASFNATGNIALDSVNNNFTTIALSGTNVSFKDSVGGVILDDVTTTGTFSATSSDGDITQTNSSLLTIAGETTLDAGNDDVNLANSTNDFQSAVNVSGADTVTLSDANGLELGNVASTGTLDVTAQDNITQKSGTGIATSGDVSLASVSGDITLESTTNNFGGSLGLSGDDVTVSNYAYALTLGDIISNGALSIATNNQAITQASGTTLVSNGTASLDAGTADVTLTNNGNDFSELTLAGNNLSFKDSVGGVTLGSIATVGTFEAVSTGGNIAQKTGTTLALTGNASFDSGSFDTVLTNDGNNFTTLALSGNDVSFKDSVGTTTLGDVTTTGTFSATNTIGGITQGVGSSMSIGTDAVFDVGTNNFTLSNSGNSFGSLGVTANDVSISNISGDLTLANMQVAGTLGVNIASNILQKAGTTIEVAGETTLASTTGDIALNGANNDFQSAVNVSAANDVTLADKNGIELGEITTTGTLGVSATGNITQKAGTGLVTGGDVALATSGNITLDSATNNFGGNFGASGKNIALTNYSYPLVLGNIVSNESLAIETVNSPITQAVGSKLTLKGTSSMDAGTSSINLGNKGNDYTAMTLRGGSVTKAETVQEEATRIEAERLAASNTISSSNITNTLIKDIKTAEVNVAKLMQPVDTIATNSTQNINTNNQLPTNFFQQNLGVSLNEQVFITSIPKQEDEIQKISYSELVNLIQSSPESQNNQTSEPQENVPLELTELRIPVTQNLMIQLVGAGVSLPAGVEQEFYISKENIRK